MLDNSELILPFVPQRDDGDTFIYTELLDRSKQQGNNGFRMLRTYYHRSQDEFREQMPEIRRMCEDNKVRAYTRLAPRSWKKVGKLHCELVVEASLTDNWIAHKALYHRACGTVTPNEKLWLWDVDEISPISERFGVWLQQHAAPRGTGKRPLLRAIIPSKKGVHYISDPFDVRRLVDGMPGSMDLRGVALKHSADGDVVADLDAHQISLHKDNPTNLYIPQSAA